MNVSDRQFGQRPAVPAEGRHRAWTDTGRAGCIAAAAALSLLFTSGLRAESAETPVFSIGPESERPTTARQITADAQEKALSADEALKQEFTQGETSIVRTVAELTGTSEAVCNKLLGGFGDGKTHPDVRDVWLKVSGGSYRAICGANNAEAWNSGSQQNFNGSRYIEMTGGTADFIFGGNWMDGYGPQLAGNTVLQIGGTAQVGSVYGANMACHGQRTEYGAADNVVSLTVRATSVLDALESCTAEGPLVQGYLVGGGVYHHNDDRSKITVHGSTAVEVVVPEASGSFQKALIGGHLATGGGSFYVDNASVVVDAPHVTFSLPIIGGGKDQGDNNTAKNTSVTLKNGTFSGTVTAGGDNAKVAGTATLEIQGGTYEPTAKLLPGNAAASVLKLGKRIDLKSVDEVGRFSRVEVPEGGCLQIAERHVHAGTVYHLPARSCLDVYLDNPDATFIFLGQKEGEGSVRIHKNDTISYLTNNRISLGGQDRLWTVPADGSWSSGWLSAGNTPAEAPLEGAFFIDASTLTQDTEVTIPKGSFETISVFGNSTTFLTLRIESGVTVKTLKLYQDARVRYAAADREMIPFEVTGSGIFETACAGRTELSHPITLEAPGLLRISGGTVAFANSNFVSGDVRVCAGAVLDCNGVPDAELATVTLEAGAIYSNDSVKEIPVGQKQITTLALEGDAFVRANAMFGMVAPAHARSYIRLNGHTLTKTGAADFICANTDCGNGALDIREGTVRTMPNGGKSTFLDITVRSANGCGIAVPEKGEWAEYSGNVTLAPDAGTQMEVPICINGGGLLHIASGTVKLLNKENRRWGGVQVDRGAVLDLTEPDVEVIHRDQPGDGYGYVSGWENHVIVRGTLRTRFWGYNGALGGLAHETNRVLLDGGTVAFPENNTEAGAMRGFTVSAKGGTLLLPAGVQYLKQKDGNASVSNAGILHLRCEGDGEPAVFSFECDVGATVDVGERVLLGGAGSVNNLRFSGTATFDTTADGFAAKRFLGNVILPRSLNVTAAAVPSAENPLMLLTPEGNSATVSGSAKRPVTLTVDGMVQDGSYVLTKTDTGALAVVPDMEADGFIGEVTADKTAGKASWNDVAASLDGSSVTANTAVVIDLATLTDNTFTFDNVDALTLSSLTLKGAGTVVLNGEVNVDRLWTDGTVTLKQGTGKLTVTGGTDLARGTVLTVEGETALAGLTLDSEAILYLGSSVTYDLQLLGEGAVIGLGLPGDTEVRDMSGLWNGVKNLDGTFSFTGPGRLGPPESLQDMRLAHNQIIDLHSDLTVNKLITSDSGSAKTWIQQTGGTLKVESSDNGTTNDTCALLFAHWACLTDYSLDRGTLEVPSGSVVLGWDGNLDMTVGKAAADDPQDMAYFSAKRIDGTHRGSRAMVTVKKTGILEIGEGGLSLTNGTQKQIIFDGGMLRTTADLIGDKLMTNAGLKIAGSAVFCAKNNTTQQPNKLVGDANAVLTVGAPNWEGTVSLAGADLNGYTGAFNLAAGTLELPAGREGTMAVPEGTSLKLQLTKDQLKQPYSTTVPKSDRERVTQILNVPNELTCSESKMYLGNVNVTGGGSLDLTTTTLTIEGDVTFDGTVMRVGQRTDATSTVVQTSGRVGGIGNAYLQFNGWSATSTYNLQGGELNLPVTFYMAGGTAALNISGGRLTSTVNTVSNPQRVTVTLSETGILETSLPAEINLKAVGGTIVGAADRTIAATAVLTGGAQGVLLDASAAPVVFSAASVADPAAALRVKAGTDATERTLVRGVGTALSDFTIEGGLPAGLKADWDANTKTLRLVAAATIPPEYTAEAGNAVLKVTGGTWPASLTGSTTGGKTLNSDAISNALTVFEGIASGDADAVAVHYEFGIRVMVFDHASNTLKLTVSLTNGTDPARLTEGTVLRLYEGDAVKVTHTGGLDAQGEAVMSLPMRDGAFLPIKVEAYKETSAPAAQ